MPEWFPRVVVVMGVSGVGKTEVGRLLAVRLAVDYVDADELHPPGNIATMRAGHPLTEEQRRPWLLAVADWLQAHDDDGGVVSCSALRRDHRDVLRTCAARVSLLHLTGDPELIRERLALRRHFMPSFLLDSQLATLEPPAADEKHLALDIGATPEQIVTSYLELTRGDTGDRARY